MLVRDPKKRITTEQALSHAFFGKTEIKQLPESFEDNTINDEDSESKV